MENSKSDTGLLSKTRVPSVRKSRWQKFKVTFEVHFTTFIPSKKFVWKIAQCMRTDVFYVKLCIEEFLWCERHRFNSHVLRNLFFLPWYVITNSTHKNVKSLQCAISGHVYGWYNSLSLLVGMVSSFYKAAGEFTGSTALSGSFCDVRRHSRIKYW